MSIYEITKDRLEEMLEKCSADSVKPADIEYIKDITETIEKLDRIIMNMQSYQDGGWEARGVYGDSYGRNTRRDSRGRYMDGSSGGYGNYGRDSRGTYGRMYDDRGRYGTDKDLVSGIEEKMASVNGEEQEVLRRAAQILGRG